MSTPCIALTLLWRMFFSCMVVYSTYIRLRMVNYSVSDISRFQKSMAIVQVYFFLLMTVLRYNELTSSTISQHKNRHQRRATCMYIMKCVWRQLQCVFLWNQWCNSVDLFRVVRCTCTCSLVFWRCAVMNACDVVLTRNRLLFVRRGV